MSGQQRASAPPGCEARSHAVNSDGLAAGAPNGLGAAWFYDRRADAARPAEQRIESTCRQLRRSLRRLAGAADRSPHAFTMSLRDVAMGDDGQRGEEPMTDPRKDAGTSPPWSLLQSVHTARMEQSVSKVISLPKLRLSLAEAAHVLGLSSNTITALEARGDFPRRVRVPAVAGGEGRKLQFIAREVEAFANGLDWRAMVAERQAREDAA